MDLDCVSDNFDKVRLAEQDRILTTQDCIDICNAPHMKRLLLATAHKTFAVEGPCQPRQKTGAICGSHVLAFFEDEEEGSLYIPLETVGEYVGRLRDCLLQFTHTDGMRRLWRHRNEWRYQFRLDWEFGPYVCVTVHKAFLFRLMWFAREGDEFRVLYPDSRASIYDHCDYDIWQKRRVTLACNAINLPHVKVQEYALVDYSGRQDDTDYLLSLQLALLKVDRYEFFATIIHVDRESDGPHIMFKPRYDTHDSWGLKLYFIDETTRQFLIPTAEDVHDRSIEMLAEFLNPPAVELT